MVGDGIYIVDYDRRGMVRARFIIPNDTKPWSLIDLLSSKVEVKFPGAKIFKIKRTPYDLDVNKSQWAIRWSLPVIEKGRKINL